MPTQYVFTARMDVAYDKESLFNEIYDKEHVPEILKVPGVLKASRYRTSNVAEPRYLGLYEISNPTVFQTPQLKAAANTGRWPAEVRPHTMNRHHAVWSWVGGGKELTYRTRYLYVVMMDVEPHKEALFNEIYDSEHIPLITKAPGCLNAVRYKTSDEGHPKYLAIYEIERPEAQGSPAWVKASDTGRWKPEVRPYTYNKRISIYERLGDVKKP